MHVIHNRAIKELDCANYLYTSSSLFVYQMELCMYRPHAKINEMKCTDFFFAKKKSFTQIKYVSTISFVPSFFLPSFSNIIQQLFESASNSMLL